MARAKQLMGELHRRNVFRVAVGYAVAAWVLAQVTQLATEAFHAPPWIMQILLVLLVVGFPVALFFAWAFEITPEGIKREADVDRTQSVTHHTAKKLDIVVIVLLVGAVVLFAADRWALDPRSPGPIVEVERLDSIAVLPFVNMSGDPENEYFGDGLAEELLNVLVRVDGLRVAARTSSFQYKDQNLDVREIAQSLGVATVLEGSVRRSGPRVRVTAQLIRAADGFHLWSETYDRSLDDIFAVQDEISLSIVDALRVTLGAEAREQVVHRGTTVVPAFEAYLRGRYEMHRRTRASLERARTSLQQAIELDPNYAAAYSGLADTWILLNAYGSVRKDEAHREAEALSLRALELDNTLAEAHASRGFVLVNQDRAEEAIPYFERAIELNPAYSPAYHWMGNAYSQLQRLDDAIASLRRAVEVDPHYIHAKRVLFLLLSEAGQYEEADRQAQTLVAEHPNEPWVLLQVASYHRSRNRFDEAETLFRRAVLIDPQHRTASMGLLNLLVRRGRNEEGLALVERLLAANPDDAGMRHQLAHRLQSMGEKDRAVAVLASTLDVDVLGTEGPGCYLTALVEAGQYEEANRQAQALVAEHPNDPWVLQQVASHHRSRNRFGEAETLFRRAVLIDPQHPASMGLLNLLVRRGRNDEGLALVERLLAANPDAAGMRHELAHQLQSMGEKDRAVAVFASTLDMDLRGAEGPGCYLTALVEAGREEQALAEAARLGDAVTDDAPALRRIARVLSGRGDLAAGLELYIRAHNAAPEESGARFDIAWILLNLGDIARSDAQVEAVRRLNLEHTRLKTWPTERARALGDWTTYLALSQSEHEERPESAAKERNVCASWRMFDDPRSIVEPCRGILLTGGWQEGEGIPPDHLWTARHLLALARHIGDTPLVTTVTADLTRAAEDLRAMPYRDRGYENLLGWIEFETTGDANRLLRAQRSELFGGDWSVPELLADPEYEALLATPAGQELAAEFSAFVAEQRARTDRIRTP